MKKKNIILLISCFVLFSCQEEAEDTQSNLEDTELLSNETESEIQELVIEQEEIEEEVSDSYAYDRHATYENWFNVKFEDFTISIDNVDIQHVSPNELLEIHQDTATFDLMPGSDALMNRHIKISQSKFDTITLYEKMGQDSDWEELESIEDNSVFKAGTTGCQFLKITLHQTSSGLSIEKMIIFRDAMTC